MNPIPVDRLFIDEPSLFAYKLRHNSERNRARLGDMVKLFFQLEEYVRPRPIWFIVASAVESESGRIFTGKIWQRYPDARRRRFGTVEFDSSHVYRLSIIGQPEIDNPLFDVEYRDEKRIVG